MIDRLIVDIFGEVVDSLNNDCDLMKHLYKVDDTIKNISYHHGHYQEIARTLEELNNSREVTNKYPLIALFEDIEYDVRNGIHTPIVNLVICYRTKATYRAKDRYKEVIEPIIVPIYEKLLSYLKICGYFNTYEFDHRMITRPYYGVEIPQGGATKTNRANIFSDNVDSIEVRSLRLPLYNNNCSPIY